MAFKQVQVASSTDIPFFDAWEKTLSLENKGTLANLLLAPSYFKPVRSGKGYLVSFSDEFIVFAWKSSSTGKFITELILNDSGFLPVIKFSLLTTKLSFDFGCDEDYEITLETDDEDNTPYTISITNGKPPISPEEDRPNIFSLPKLKKPPALTKLSKTSKSTPRP